MGFQKLWLGKVTTRFLSFLLSFFSPSPTRQRLLQEFNFSGKIFVTNLWSLEIFLPLDNLIVRTPSPVGVLSRWRNWLLKEGNSQETCIVHVGTVIHDYQGGGANWSRKWLWWWKDSPLLNINFCRSRPYQRESSLPSGPGQFCLVLFSPSPTLTTPEEQPQRLIDFGGLKGGSPNKENPLGRVLGLPIRDCARSCNSSEHRQTTVSTIDVTGKTFFVFGSRTETIWVSRQMSVCCHTPTVG